MPSDLAALRGEPSYVWRSGQERRLQMVARWAKLENAVFLEHGMGVGMYAAQVHQRFTPYVAGFDIELTRAIEAHAEVPFSTVAAAEALPYASNIFDTVLSSEVLEHVQNDERSACEMVRVTKPGGRIVIFVPNRWYPFETHGHYWRGKYHFGNTPLINYLPDIWRNQLAPHVKAYTKRGLLRLFKNTPVKMVHYSRIYGGYDNIVVRFGTPGKWIRGILHRIENTPLDTWGLSHLLVLEKTP